MRVAVAVPLSSLVALILAGAAGAGAGTSAPIKVTFVGDSVPASISYVPQARAVLRKRLDVRLDLRVCRRLVVPSCPYQGSTPSTALEAVRSYGGSLGDVLVVEVGYNESAQGYREGIDEVMRAAVRQGVTGVVWVTLRAARDTYRWTNIAIRTAAKRWPQLVVADWDRYSRGKPWFGPDGLHLTAAGATALAGFLRPYVFRAAGRTNAH